MSRLLEPASTAISFQFLAEIAVGATTRVDLCRMVLPRPGELIAVKRLLPRIANDPGFSTQFLDEVWITAALKHPNVVDVVGWGSDAQGPYLAFELVQGVSLARLMKTVFETGEIFPERLVVYVAAELCRGLSAAHALRSRTGELLHLVHRDLTPGNVLIGFNGDVKIADFGIAKAKLRMTRTLTGIRKGAPSYMAPEQALGLEIDGRADLFSLGVMLFELFAGRHPWAALNGREVVHLSANWPPTDLREFRPKIDKEILSIVLRCLDKDPAGRFQSAGEILGQLDEWLHAHGYMEGSKEALGRFVRRNAMRQMRWFERAVAGELADVSESAKRPQVPSYVHLEVQEVKGRKGRGLFVDEEITEVSANREVRVVPPHGQTQPVIHEVASDPLEDEPTEEGSKAVAEGEAGRAGHARPRNLSAYDLVDRESQPTAVKPFHEPMPLAGPLAALPRVAPGAFDPRAQSPDPHGLIPLTAQLGAALTAAPLAETERIRAEADRLAGEAARYHEEAAAAAAEAEQRASLAHAAVQAAALAAEAVRLATSASVAGASRWLDEALAIERSVQRAGASLSTPPPRAAWAAPALNGSVPLPPFQPPLAGHPPSSRPPFAGHPTPSSRPPLTGPPPPSSRPPGGAPVAGLISTASLGPGSAPAPAMPSYFNAQDAVTPGSRPPSTSMPLGARSMVPDATAFGSHLQPMRFGMPRLLVVIAAAIVFFLVLGLLFLLFG